MERLEFRRLIQELPSSELAILVSLLVREMTISSRRFYEVGTEDVLDAHHLRSYMERIHRIIQFVPDVLRAKSVDRVRNALQHYYSYSGEEDATEFDGWFTEDCDRAAMGFAAHSLREQDN